MYQMCHPVHHRNGECTPHTCMTNWTRIWTSTIKVYKDQLISILPYWTILSRIYQSCMVTEKIQSRIQNLREGKPLDRNNPIITTNQPTCKTQPIKHTPPHTIIHEVYAISEGVTCIRFPIYHHLDIGFWQSVDKIEKSGPHHCLTQIKLPPPA